MKIYPFKTPAKKIKIHATAKYHIDIK